MAAGVVRFGGVTYTDLTQIVDINPPPYDPRIEEVYQQRIKIRESLASGFQSEFDENAINMQWASEDEERKSKSLSRAPAPRASSRRSGSKGSRSPFPPGPGSPFPPGRGAGPPRISPEVNVTGVEGQQHTAHTPAKVSLVEEPDVLEFNDTFDLDNEEAWNSIPRSHRLGRFAQYRQLSRVARDNLEEEVAEARKSSERKVNSLKVQFQAHRARWSRDRDNLLEAVRQVEEQKTVAQELGEMAVGRVELLLRSAGEKLEGSPIDPSGREAALLARISQLEGENITDQNKLKSVKDSKVKKTTSEDGDELVAAEDVPFPPDEADASEHQRDQAVSASSSLVKRGMQIADHPIVKEYLNTYKHLVTFREKLAGLLADTEVNSPVVSELLNFQPITFHREDRVIPQVEGMRHSAETVLNHTLALLQHLLSAVDKEWTVPTDGWADQAGTGSRSSYREEEDEEIGGLPKDHPTRLKAELKELRGKYDDLKEQFESNNKKYEDQINHSTSVMLEMQTTIGELRRELSALQADAGRASRGEGSEPTLLFSRLDSERNARVLKKAVIENRLERFLYEDALEKMEDYTRIPAERLAFLVKKYLHQQTMKRIAEYVRKNRTLDENVFQLLDKMEFIFHKRERRYSQLMDYMSEERIRHAHRLVETFDNIEQSCSIFLIRPVLTLKSRESLQQWYVDIMKRRQQAAIENKGKTARSTGEQLSPGPEMRGVQSKGEPEPSSYWNPSVSRGRHYLADSLAMVNTPRLLEMDVNRLLMSQNNVSVRMPIAWQSLDTDSQVPSRHLMTAPPPPHMSVRSYITIARPSTQPKLKSDSPVTPAPPADLKSAPPPTVQPIGKSVLEPNKAPPTTPLEARVPSAELRSGSKDLTGQPPLPPITPREEEEEDVFAAEEEETEATSAGEEGDEEEEEEDGEGEEEQ